MRLQFQQVRTPVETTGEGMLVFLNGWLIAVLVRLSEDHGATAGHWFPESLYGSLGEAGQPVFCDLEEAEHWLKSQVIERRSADFLWKKAERNREFLPRP